MAHGPAIGSKQKRGNLQVVTTDDALPAATCLTAAVSHLNQIATVYELDEAEAVALQTYLGLTHEDGVAQGRTTSRPSAPTSDIGLGWGIRCREDLEHAAELFAALKTGNLHLAWQAVRAAESSTTVLYYEALLRGRTDDGVSVTLGNVIPAVERLGLIRALDHHVVSLVLAELGDSAEVALGANISGQSARFDMRWSEIEAHLAKHPSIAKRLILEVTETAELAPGASDFIDRMRRLGVRIALDDFGMGHASIRRLMALSPDIVKIDASFLHDANQSKQSCATLEHMVGLAGALAPVVIVEGVETAVQSQLAEAAQVGIAGTCWQQGWYHGMPSTLRSWRRPAADQCVGEPNRFRETFYKSGSSSVWSTGLHI